jgi:hypothetical protein
MYPCGLCSAIVIARLDMLLCVAQLVYSHRIPELELSLLERILIADPNKRLSAKMALNNRCEAVASFDIILSISYYLPTYLPPGTSYHVLRGSRCRH